MKSRDEIKEELKACLETEQFYAENGIESEEIPLNQGWIEALEWVIKKEGI